MNALFRRITAGALAVILATTLSLAVPAPSVEAQSGDNSRYAAIVVDATTGEVLFARRADSQRYPASVTKIMTLYLVFEALSEGKVSLDDVVTVSPLAASQPPSKLGLASGQTIRLDDAMRATAVRSANDMAMLLAEHVGGSQARFAAMATLKAQQLGMSQTRYVNPNGLPDSRQVTTARDLAILSRAVMRDYPQYYSYFGLHDWAYNGRDYRNTNGLLLAGNGYDGIKTGFTNASGYNLAASAVRDGRRIITIVMGGRTVPSRNAHVAELMNTGFEVEDRRARGEPIQIAQTFFEQRGFGVSEPESESGSPVAYASAETEDTGMGSNEVAYTAAPAPTPDPARGATVYASIPSAPAFREAPVRRNDSRPAAVANTPVLTTSNMTATLNGGPATSTLRAPATATPRPAAPRAETPRPAAPRPATQRWAVQVGAFRDETVARNWLTEVNRRFRAQFANAERTVQTAGEWHRSRFTGLTQASAESACEALAARRVTCMVVRPE